MAKCSMSNKYFWELENTNMPVSTWFMVNQKFSMSGIVIISTAGGMTSVMVTLLNLTVLRTKYFWDTYLRNTMLVGIGQLFLGELTVSIAMYLHMSELKPGPHKQIKLFVTHILYIFFGIFLLAAALENVRRLIRFKLPSNVIVPLQSLDSNRNDGNLPIERQLGVSVGNEHEILNPEARCNDTNSQTHREMGSSSPNFHEHSSDILPSYDEATNKIRQDSPSDDKGGPVLSPFESTLTVRAVTECSSPYCETTV
ncbi:uncharacterized protein TRIADDRAFT_51516 [Trichoplax adhaerens]|uniref:Uncharacterized protein n=1 Tax=Trichoplax adhaerens TaxID=10228 RepID=B3RJM2_TRIAD|nr:predicted protein [Trichoplax adhaerens]EDV28518.1 predicted protein [Trichoplax adhaerens]|eukprot:XP_002107720.1 predicted protein [Trichoplax adhaerens]